MVEEAGEERGGGVESGVGGLRMRVEALRPGSSEARPRPGWKVMANVQPHSGTDIDIRSPQREVHDKDQPRWGTAKGDRQSPATPSIDNHNPKTLVRGAGQVSTTPGQGQLHDER